MDDSAAHLLDVTWVHLFEEDTPTGEVFVRDDGDIPLSRRPRVMFTLHENGTADMTVPGANDRPQSQSAHWTVEGADVVVRADEGGCAIRIIEVERARLIVQLSNW